MHVLHVIQQLSKGGASRALTALAVASTRAHGSTHQVVSLVPASARALADEAQLPLLDAPSSDDLATAIASADVVLVHFWNTPELTSFMRACTTPARIVVWAHVTGDTPPHLVTHALRTWADITVLTSPTIPALPVIPGAADFSRLSPPPTPNVHETYNVGYIGTVDPVKMHPDFVALSTSVDIRSARFIVHGSGGGFAALARQAAARGAEWRFEWRGYTDLVGDALARFDVFGYPICHGSADLVVQEAMYAGVPPVLFNTTGTQHLVRHGDTGLVVQTATEYARALEHLYHHPDERRRLGANAARWARAHLGADRAAAAMRDVYAEVVKGPKRVRTWPTHPTDEDVSGARRFMEWLGEMREPFETSLTSTDLDTLLDADARIAGVPPLLTDAASGGVLHYRRAFSRDAHLRLWSGLVLRAMGRPALAAAEFDAAVALGLTDERTRRHLHAALRAASGGDGREAAGSDARPTSPGRESC